MKSPIHPEILNNDKITNTGVFKTIPKISVTTPIKKNGHNKETKIFLLEIFCLHKQHKIPFSKSKL